MDFKDIFLDFLMILGWYFDTLLETWVSWKTLKTNWFLMNFKGPSLQNIVYFGCFSWVNRWCISEALFSWIWVSFLMTFGMLLGSLGACISWWLCNGFLKGVQGRLEFWGRPKWTVNTCSWGRRGNQTGGGNINQIADCCLPDHKTVNYQAARLQEHWTSDKQDCRITSGTLEQVTSRIAG